MVPCLSSWNRRNQAADPCLTVKLFIVPWLICIDASLTAVSPPLTFPFSLTFPQLLWNSLTSRFSMPVTSLRQLWPNGVQRVIPQNIQDLRWSCHSPWEVEHVRDIFAQHLYRWHHATLYTATFLLHSITKSQAVARIADCTAKNSSGHVT